MLTELVTTLDAPDGGWLVSEANLPAVMEMVGVNVFRALPPSSEERRAAATRRIKMGGPSAAGVEGAGGGGGGSEGGEGGGGDDEPTLEPAWPHLELVYELLLRVIMHPDVSAARRQGSLWLAGSCCHGPCHHSAVMCSLIVRRPHPVHFPAGQAQVVQALDRRPLLQPPD